MQSILFSITNISKTEPSFNILKKYLKYHDNIERLIALSKYKIIEREHKWSQLQLILIINNN